MHVRVHLARDAVHKKEDIPFPQGAMGTLKEYRDSTIARAERQYLQELMAMTGWNIKKACEVSGLSRVRLYVLLKEYNITRRQSLDVS
jgi:two-component system NtrC family response regulator